MLINPNGCEKSKIHKLYEKVRSVGANNNSDYTVLEKFLMAYLYSTDNTELSTS